MEGINTEKFGFANGSGGNAKGFLNELATAFFGNYSYVLPSTVLTNKQKQSSNPEIANLKNKRIAFVREPSEDDVLQVGIIKELTGGDEINARMNYSNECKTELKITLICECNKKPKLQGVDGGFARRIIDVPFESRFVEQDEYNLFTKQEIKEQNIFLQEKSLKGKEFKNEFKQALFYILKEYYELYYKNNRQIVLADKIKNRNRTYLQNNDFIYCFITDNYIKSDVDIPINNKNTLKIKDIFNKFKESEYFNNLDKKDKNCFRCNEFKDKLESNIFLRNYVKPNKSDVYCLKNFIIKPTDEDTTGDDSDDDDEHKALD
jgi:phage/plasmid-associated DNA primase